MFAGSMASLTGLSLQHVSGLFMSCSRKMTSCACMLFFRQQNKASADFSQLTALQQTVAARVANRQLYPTELCQLGGMQKLTTAGEETILQAIGSVRHSLESLTETDLTGLLRMALNVTNPDKQLIVEVSMCRQGYDGESVP